MCVMTGSPCAPGGAQTLMNRQFSLPAIGPIFPDAPCVQMLPTCVAFNVPLQGAAGRGGAQRRLPTGGAAYGMPSHSLTPFTTMPQTAPLAVITVVPAAHACAEARPAGTATAAAQSTAAKETD